MIITSHEISTIGPGLVGWLEDKRVRLPLKGAECCFKVRGGVAEVVVHHIFYQNNTTAIDCTYVFPLPADAAVYACSADINGRLIVARVEEREAARRLAEEKKAEGHRTVLVESERENLFTLGLGNLQPSDMVVVRLAYIQPLRRLADHLSLEIPLCAGERYMPGRPLLRANCGKGVVDDTDLVPDASRISPPRIDALHPDAAYVDIEGAIDEREAVAETVASPSHAIERQQVNGCIQIQLSDAGEVPDRNFLVRWNEPVLTEISHRGWSCRKDGCTYALLELRAPKLPDEAETAPVHMFFLADRSGSMRGVKWEKTAAAIQACASGLGPRDRVMVTLFSNTPEDMTPAPLAPADLLAQEAFLQLASRPADGGTEMAAALSHVLELVRRHSTRDSAQVVLITDAEVGDDDRVLKTAAGMPDLPFHCLGIDTTLNDSLLRRLCTQQGGTFHALSPNDDVTAAVTKLAKTLRQPVIRRPSPAGDWESAEGRMPDLYSGQVRYAALRAKGDLNHLQVDCRDPQDAVIRLDFHLSESVDPAPWLVWCRQRLEHLLFAGQIEEAITLSKAANQVCLRTAFVAWDEAENVAVARGDLVQPSLEPVCITLGPEASAMFPHRDAPCFCYPAQMAPLPMVGLPAMDMIDDAEAGRVVDAARPRSGLANFLAGMDMIDAEAARVELTRIVGRMEQSLPEDLKPYCRRLSDWCSAAADPVERRRRVRALRDLNDRLQMTSTTEPDLRRQLEGVSNLLPRLRKKLLRLSHSGTGTLDFGRRIVAARDSLREGVERLDRLHEALDKIHQGLRDALEEFVHRHGIS